MLPRLFLFSALSVAAILPARSQTPARQPQSAALAPRVTYTPKTSRADSLRGSYTTPARSWWDVAFYDLHVAVSPSDSSIRGYNGITYRVLQPAKEMQIDLMLPLAVDSMVQDGRQLRYRREGAAFFVTLATPQRAGDRKTVTVFYHGRPQVAKNPPWQGGFSWTTDSLGRTWVATTDQGMGASAWWPNKDTQADEPDSQRVALTLPDPMIDVSNGRLRTVQHHDDGTTTYEWFAKNPINNYAIAVAAGSYVHYSDVYNGLNGPLTMDYWPLDYDLENAKRQWVQAKSMMQCFEHWFGPYPWYEDGYKLIQVPNTGMEHQSAVSYGNWFQNGYRKRDGSGTGLGLKWDFIIVHESAHEWFGNNITSKDNADMWVHESFANYAEGLYTECLFGKDDGARYIIGNRRGIRNDRPIIPAYGVNDQGSGDMYPKGGEMLHTIRQLVNDDEKWRSILVGLNRTFWHQTVTGSQVEQYISQRSGMNLGKVFDQYLRSTMIPTFEYHIADGKLTYRWSTVVPAFDMPLRVKLDGTSFTLIRPTSQWQTTPVSTSPANFAVDENFYVVPKAVDGPTAP
ncbi:MAG: M1 family metallopeptidase [bacterium]